MKAATYILAFIYAWIYFFIETSTSLDFKDQLILINSSEWYSYFTYQFIHSSTLHIIANLLTLLFCGIILDKKINPLLFYSVYFITIILCGFMHTQHHHTALIGCSGGVMYVFAFTALYEPLKKVGILKTNLIVIWVSTLIAMTYLAYTQNNTIAHTVHATGSVMGIAMYWCVKKSIHKDQS